MLSSPNWKDLDRTDPWLLQPAAPTIDDTQRSAVLRAEDRAKAALPEVGVSELEVRQVLEAASYGGSAPAVVLGEDGSAVEYWRKQRLLVVGTDASLYDVVHEAAHHVTDPVFPAHGVEWVNGFLRLLREVCGEVVESTFKAEFDAANVHRSVAWQLGRVKKNARGKTNKERGAIARVILDGPPEQVICQLLEMRSSGLVVINHNGEDLLPFERIRYLACDLTKTD